MLADDLLQQAYHLASVDRVKPKQANLRRAVSSGYYALFHLLVADAVKRISPASPVNLGQKIARVFVHSEMKQVCKSVKAGQTSEVLQQLQPGGFSAQLRDVAGAFVVIQEARHQADYDTSSVYLRSKTIDLIDRVQRAFRDWKSLRMSDEATVFLAALLFANRWSK